VSGEGGEGGGPAAGAEVERLAVAYLKTLSLEEKVLLDVRDELYGGDWGELEADLRARHAGKPHIFRLMTKIEEDLVRLDALRAWETARGVDLGRVKRRLEEERAREDDARAAGAAAGGRAAPADGRAEQQAKAGDAEER
jgi:hypothetical protein